MRSRQSCQNIKETECCYSSLRTSTMHHMIFVPLSMHFIEIDYPSISASRRPSVSLCRLFIDVRPMPGRRTVLFLMRWKALWQFHRADRRQSCKGELVERDRFRILYTTYENFRVEPCYANVETVYKDFVMDVSGKETREAWKGVIEQWISFRKNSVSLVSRNSSREH